MLAAYRTNTNNLLQNPAASSALYALASVDLYINMARGQLAGEAECIRYRATISTVIGQREYSFEGLNTGTPATNGIAGIIHIRDILYGVASGARKITPRPWEWFQQYGLNNPVPSNGVPTSWAQYGQGAAPAATGAQSTGSGSFFIDPPPDAVYDLTCDCVCYPITLTDDTDPEAIPYLWTDAVPFFAAYYALLSSQTSARQADAERMMGHYQTFLERARKASNPSVLRWQYPQSTDPTQLNKMGLANKGAQQGGG